MSNISTRLNRAHWQPSSAQRIEVRAANVFILRRLELVESERVYLVVCTARERIFVFWLDRNHGILASLSFTWNVKDDRRPNLLCIALVHAGTTITTHHQLRYPK
jgi:hypothetical protein